ncbi:MAG: 3'-5' exonuclease [Chloroflexi bacterium]|nr:3'-5' exonuclease [Chloroflexota bacterium]
MKTLNECYISVDVETAGPNPSEYSLLSIGACFVADSTRAFYIELQPLTAHATTEALAVNHLSMRELAARGAPPAEAMRQFDAWLAANVPAHQQPIFVAFNAPFDWMFINDYFMRYLGRNPFGHTALDIKAYYMGAQRVTWAETRMREIVKRFQIDQPPLTHNALDDARDQARLFRHILEETHKT